MGESSSPYTNPKTEKNVTAIARKNLPKSPRKFATVLHRLCCTSTPRKRSAVIQLASKYKASQMKSSRIVSRKLVKYSTEIRKKSWFKPFSAEWRIQIRKFYMREDISKPLPCCRYATKLGAAYVLQSTLASAFNQFKEEFPQIQVGFTKFTLLRPKQVKILTSKFRDYCVCSCCANIMLKLSVVNKIIPKEERIQDEDDVIMKILCPKQNNKFHLKECLLGHCDNCKDYKETLRNIIGNHQNQLKWNRWERVTGDSGVVKKQLVTKEGNLDVFLDEMCRDLRQPVMGTTYPYHLFTAKWQQQQYTKLKENLPRNTMLMVMDFARNKTLEYQDEIKSAYYQQGQVTMHPIVVYYHQSPEDGQLTRESLIFLSDDLGHDFHAVNYYLEKSLEHFKSKEMNFSKVIIFSDGCSAQYKGKGPFADLSLQSVQMERSYFGSEHGKSEGDGEIGAVSKMLERGVLGRKVILQNANDVYNFCSSRCELNNPYSLRSFHLVKKGEIDRDRPYASVKTLSGTRKFHQVKNVNEPYALNVRNLSCYCIECVSEKYTLCINKEYVDNFTKRKLKLANDTTAAQKVHPKSSHDSGVVPAKALKCARPLEAVEEKLPLQPTIDTQETHPAKRRKLVKDCIQNTAKAKYNLRGKIESNTKIAEKSRIFQDHPASTCTSTTRTHYFKNLQEELKQCKTWTMLRSKIQSSLANLVNYLIPSPVELSGNMNGAMIDTNAMSLYPQDCNSNLVARMITPDGNCLPRCGSLLLFGTEEHHVEIRIRMIIEQTLFKSYYLSNKGLRKQVGEQNIAKTYAMFSDELKQGDKLSPKTVERIYESEVFSVIGNGTYCGIWQLHALTTVLKCNVQSIYPDYAGGIVKKHFHREIVPRMGKSENTVHIMWTNTSGKRLKEVLWKPNHFVVCVPCGQNNVYSQMVDNQIQGELEQVKLKLHQSDSDTDIIEGDRTVKSVVSDEM